MCFKKSGQHIFFENVNIVILRGDKNKLWRSSGGDKDGNGLIKEAQFREKGGHYPGIS